ncbi:hypothetical protein ACJRO7_024180 [Eucalyptus globulus]|uniref:Uncharacterized protein n=1 Tax=Eucalyptus globulus TaxID=34317 RepID=A0ABD3KBB4_EUCGL
MLHRIWGVSDCEVEAEFNDIMEVSEASKTVKDPWSNLSKEEVPATPDHVGAHSNIPAPYRDQRGHVCEPVLFITIGFGNDASLMSAVIPSGVNVAATFISVYGTDKWGHRHLFF